MKPYIQKILVSIFIVLTSFLMLAPLSFAAPVSEVSGFPIDTNETSSDSFCWNATTFGGFNYQVNKNKDIVASENWIGERLQYVEKDGHNELGKNNPGNHEIGEGELVYSTRPLPNTYALVSGLELNASTTPQKLGGISYYKLAWFGKPYVTVENDSTQLANLVINQASDEKKELKTGETWDLGKNYSLVVNQVDVEGKKVWFSLFKNREELESGIINADGTVENKTFIATADFGNGNDQLYFITYVDSVFMNTAGSFAIFKYTWLIDKGEVMVIKSGNEYQGFKVKEASKNEIVLENNKSIVLNLNKDVKNYFTDSWYFQTSDEGKGSTSPQGYVIYPATDITLGDQSTVGSAKDMSSKGEANLTNVTGTVLNATDPKNDSSEFSSGPLIQSSFEGSKNDTIQSEEAAEKTPLKIPDFKILFAILGISLSHVFLRKRN